MRVSLGKRLRLGTRGAPAGVLGSGVDGPLRNQLLMAHIMKILGITQSRHGTINTTTGEDGLNRLIRLSHRAGTADLNECHKNNN